VFKKILVRDLISEGERLLEGLRRNRFPVVAALWSYFPESMEWRLVLASPAVDHQGPLAAYGRVQRVLSGTNPSQLTLSDIALIGPESADYQNLRQVLSRPGQFTTGAATSQAGNVIFEDSYVYPLRASQR
jgi:hypothetical protein